MSATNTQPASAAAFRIWTCGTFRVERRVGESYQPIGIAEWGGSTYPRLLLKGLLCCPGRRARRDALQEMLWRDADPEQAVQFLNRATSKLRSVLQPGRTQASLLLTTEEASYYRLEDQSCVWVDADAALLLLEQAERMSSTGEDALALLEEAAQYFAGGPFLDGDDGLWLYGRRSTVDIARHRCLLWQATLYEQRGWVQKAQDVLLIAWQEDMSDEDVLCRAMALLHRQGMTSQALKLYKRTTESLAQDELEPTETTKALAERLRNEPCSLPAVLAQPIEDNNLTSFDPSRRALLTQLLGIASITTVSIDAGAEAWERLLSIPHEPIINADAFNYFQNLLESCWGLCNQGEMHTAMQILSSFLPHIIQHALYQPVAASLAAQGLRLQSILNAHQLQVPTMIPLCQQAVEYARQVNNYNGLTAALIGLAVAFKYAQQPENSFHTYQEALIYCEKASPLVRSRVYAGSAAAFAQKGYTQEAYTHIRLAYENFPDYPEADPHFLSTDNGLFMLAYYEGLMYLAMNQPEKARNAFESFGYYSSSSTIPMPERNRLEIVNYRGKAAILSNDMEVYARCLEDGMLGAIALKSKKRYDEALHIYQQDVPGQWRSTALIKHITERFQLLPGEW